MNNLYIPLKLDAEEGDKSTKIVTFFPVATRHNEVPLRRKAGRTLIYGFRHTADGYSGDEFCGGMTREC
jgi:hypothetical protein